MVGSPPESWRISICPLRCSTASTRRQISANGNASTAEVRGLSAKQTGQDRLQDSTISINATQVLRFSTPPQAVPHLDPQDVAGEFAESLDWQVFSVEGCVGANGSKGSDGGLETAGLAPTDRW